MVENVANGGDITDVNGAGAEIGTTGDLRRRRFTSSTITYEDGDDNFVSSAKKSKKKAASRAAQTVAAAAQGVSAHISWQLLSRVLSFLLRGVVVRKLGPAQVGSTELNVGLIQRFCTLPISAFRKVALRAPTRSRAQSLCFACVLVTSIAAMCVTSALGIVYSTYRSALALLAVGLVFRAAAEPGVNFTTRQENYSQNSRSRAISVLCSGLAAAISVRKLPPAPASAMGHCVYGIFMCITFRTVTLQTFRCSFKDLRKEDLYVAGVHYLQSFLKFCLGHGESFVLAMTTTSNELGAYILAGNIASIVLRFFHDGLEDQCFNVFSRLSPAFYNERNAAYLCKPEKDTSTSKSTEDNERKASQTLCISTMHLALKASLLVSALFAAIGPAFSYSAIRILYAEEWSEEAPTAIFLSRYFLYLLFMSPNGITEAFLLASAGPRTSNEYWKFSFGLACAYISALMVSGHYFGALGVIAVNSANMVVRALYAGRFYCAVTGQRPVQLIKGGTPTIGTIAVLLIGRYGTLSSEKYFISDTEFEGKLDLLTHVAAHAISGAAACAAFAGALWKFERTFLKNLFALLKGSPARIEGECDARQHAE